MKLTPKQLRELKAFARVTHELQSQHRGLVNAGAACRDYKARLQLRRQQLDAWLAAHQASSNADPAGVAEEQASVAKVRAEIEEINAGLADNELEVQNLQARMKQLSPYSAPRRNLIERLCQMANSTSAELGINFNPRDVERL